MYVCVCVCGASYCVVDPAVGDLRSSSVSENAVLHTLYTRVFPQVTKGWLILFHLCRHTHTRTHTHTHTHTHTQTNKYRKISLWPFQTGELWLFYTSNKLWDRCERIHIYWKIKLCCIERLDQMAVPHSAHINNTSQKDSLCALN